MSLAGKRQDILSLLRQMANRPLVDETAVWSEIEMAIEPTGSGQLDRQFKKEIDNCIYALALVYAHYVGALPAFSNSDRQTRFERFVLAIPIPKQFRITPNRIKASIRRLDPKRNPTFARDLKLMALRHAAEENPPRAICNIQTQ
jgi:hypothetical protein